MPKMVIVFFGPWQWAVYKDSERSRIVQLTPQDLLDNGLLQAEEPPSASGKARGMKRNIFVVLGLVIFLLGFSSPVRDRKRRRPRR